MSRFPRKVGLLGAGFIIEAHAKALKTLPQVEMVAVCDLSANRAEAASRNFGITRAYTSLDEMLQADLDVVHVLLPPDLHVEATRKILESGRHVFLEKPMAPSAEACRELVKLANDKGVKLGINHNFLFLKSYEKLRQEVEDGTLGQLDQITVNWLYPLGLIQFGPYNNWMLREPGNLFYELGAHLASFAIDLAGPPETLSAAAFRPADLPGGSRVYRRWHAHMLSGNTTVDLNLSVAPGYADRSVNIRGRAASVKLDYERDLYVRDEPSGHGLLFDNFVTTEKVAAQQAWKGLVNLFRTVVGTLKKSPAANPFEESIQRSIATFYDTVDGKLDPRLDGAFGAEVIALCERIINQAQLEAQEDSSKVWDVLPSAKPPTVLVLGGTGFIGRYLVKKLCDRGYGVRVVTRSMGAGKIGLAGLPVELVQGDLANADFMDQALQGIEVLYHLSKMEADRWQDYYQGDVLVTKNIAERAQLAGIKRFIYTGTIDSYYSADEDEVITGETPLDPDIVSRNHYARSKAESEALLLKMYREQGFPVVIFRPGVVIGKGCPPAHWGVGMFQSETRVQFWGNGRNKLPLILVEDVAEALVLGMDKQDLEGRTLLLTDEPFLSAREYVDVVSRESGTRLRAKATPIWTFYVGDVIKETLKHLIKHPNRKKPSYRDWDSRSHRARYDSSLTRKLLDWKPAGNRADLIEKGIVAAVKEYYR